MKPLLASKPSSSVKYGSIFRIGERHLLALGDARDAQLVKTLVGEKKIATVLTDVPYGIKRVESAEGFSKLSVTKKIIFVLPRHILAANLVSSQQQIFVKKNVVNFQIIVVIINVD